MKLEKAIEIADDLERTYAPVLLPHRKEALKLLIEAGKRIYTSRHSKHHGDKKLLPGETD